MKQNKILFMMIAGAMLTAGCSDDQVAETAANGRVPIELGYTLQQAQVTRSITDNINDKYIAPGGQVHVDITNHTTPTDVIYNGSYYVVESGTATINTVANTPISKMAPMDGVPYYPVDGSKVDIKAYYPARAASGTFSIMTDQSTDEGYAASDLMWATPVTEQGISDNPVNLNFNHKLAKIVININKKTGVTAVTSVRMMQVKPTVTFDTSDGTTGTASGTATTITVAKGTDVSKCAVIIPAQTIAGTLLQVVTDGGTATFNVASQTFAANHRYTTTIDVGASNIDLTNTITAWDDEDFSAVKSYTAKSLGELTNLINSGGAYSGYLGWYVKADGTISSSNTSAVGIIAYMSQDDVDVDIPGSRVLVLSMSELTTAGWGTLNELSGVGTSSSIPNGYSNTIYLVSKYGNSKAAGICWAQGSSPCSEGSHWFLPSAYQWNRIMSVNGVGGGTNDRSKTGMVDGKCYWSSTDYSTTTALAVAANGGIGDGNKSFNYNIRACFAYPSVYASLTTKHVGWLLTSEGYVYPHVKEAEAAGHHPVAMIAYVGTPGSVDTSTGAGHYRGLAIALTNASDREQWDDTGSRACLSQSYTFTQYWNASTSTFGKKDGIGNTKTLTSDSHNHASATAAKEYSETAPPGTSGWFLPSGGQWLMFFAGAGLPMSSWTSWGDCPALTGSTKFANWYTVKNLFINAGVGSAIKLGSYETSSESGNNLSVHVSLYNPGGVHMSDSGKQLSHIVRAFLAF